MQPSKRAQERTRDLHESAHSSKPIDDCTITITNKNHPIVRERQPLQTKHIYVVSALVRDNDLSLGDLLCIIDTLRTSFVARLSFEGNFVYFVERVCYNPHTLL